MRFPFVKQKDSMQCGVAALAMVCRHFGMPYSTAFLDTLCSPTAEGVSMLGISRAATELGLDNVSGRGDLLRVDSAQHRRGGRGG